MSTARLAPLVSYGDFRFEGGERSTEELVAQGATALLVGNNLMAVGALHALKRAGQRVGTDIAVVGIDDPPWAELTDPPLTALAQPVREMAAAAVDLLLARLRLDGTHKRPRRKVFEFELHHRGSCCGGGPEVGP
jgi:DNA-binding LacI/PurR family transcriptional regulator